MEQAAKGPEKGTDDKDDIDTEETIEHPMQGNSNTTKPQPRKSKSSILNMSVCTYIYIYIYIGSHIYMCGSVVKNVPANAGNVGLIPGSRRSLGIGDGNPL